MTECRKMAQKKQFPLSAIDSGTASAYISHESNAKQFAQTHPIE
jgi:hypothetical protein